MSDRSQMAVILIALTLLSVLGAATVPGWLSLASLGLALLACFNHWILTPYVWVRLNRR